ncbi:MAG: hypothetical protein ACOCX4_00765 [Planctomycetota bacterium]
MQISDHDRTTLRDLGARIMEVASLPEQAERAERWRRLNRLEPVRPLVYINEIPWHEMNVDDELTLRCEDPFCQGIETSLRRTLYQWNHMPGDMVVDPVLYSPVPHTPQSCYSGWGVEENAVRAADGHGSAGFIPVITSEADLDKLGRPEVTVDWDAAARNREAMASIFDGVIPIEQRGIVTQWMAPWDVLIHWYGIEQLYIDMIDRPELVHALLGRFMDGVHHVLDRQAELGLLSVSNGNHRVGSGGLGITDELPGPDNPPAHVGPEHQWGTSTGQIFSEVSPDMHEEFCLRYERPYLARFGLTCYGCCEPLHNKMHLMRTIPNLRRISMSTWIDVEKAVAGVGADYVFSRKPNPAVLAAETWSPAQARTELVDFLAKAEGCRVELVMKDISTVRNEPQRLWEWERIAMDAARAAEAAYAA